MYFHNDDESVENIDISYIGLKGIKGDEKKK